MKWPTIRALMIGILGFISAGSSIFAAGQNPPKSDLVRPENVQGCYELSLSEWRPKLDLGDDVAFITPPRRVQLLSEKITPGLESQSFAVKPAHGVEASIHRTSYWSPKSAKSIEIVWTTGFSGLVMVLQVGDSEMRGQAQTFWDFPRTRQQAEVVARSVKCDETPDLADAIHSGCQVGAAQPKIVAGQGWGPVRIGAASSAVHAFVGQGQRIRTYSNVYLEDYGTTGIQIGFENDTGAVHNIYFFNHQRDSPEFAGFCGKLDTGLDWTSSVEDVKKAYGRAISDFTGHEPDETWERLVFDGIDFRFENDKMVRIGIPGN